jgi:16S rRNA (guanine(966)-N(2))-methyltransferase RsmD
MRIISGIHKGKKIYSVEGMTSRPTTDFIREMIFSTLYSLDADYSNTLDLFAGSGAMGFEALSRGAEQVTFVEGSNKAVSTIIANIELLQCKDKCRVVRKKVESFLCSHLEACEVRGERQNFTLVFADPPYNKGLVNSTLKMIIESSVLAQDGLIVFEHSKDEPISFDFRKYLIKEKQSGPTVVSFMRL